MTWSRRELLRAGLVSGSVALAGCAMSPFPERDERVRAAPPGDPPLDPGGAWPSYRYDAGNTGANPDGHGVRDGEEYWRLDAGIGAPALADGRMFSVYDGAETEVTVRNPATAVVRSSVDVDAGGPVHPPVVAGDHVVAATYGELVALDPTTGQEAWRRTEFEDCFHPPTADDGRVFLSTISSLQAFDSDGTRRWQYDALGETLSTPAVADGTVFVASADGLHAVDAATGERVFHRSEFGNEAWTPVVHDGTIYTATAGEDDDTMLVAVDAADGTEHWRTVIDPGNHRVPPVVTDSRVYARGSDGIVALDAADGSPLTRSRLARPMGLVGDVLYGAEDGVVRAYDTTTELDVLWSYATEDIQVQDTVGRIVHSLTSVDGAVYVDGRDAFHGIGPAR